MNLGIVELTIIALICLAFLAILIGGLAAIVYFTRRSK